jgi:hypothetical protein
MKKFVSLFVFSFILLGTQLCSGMNFYNVPGGSNDEDFVIGRPQNRSTFCYENLKRALAPEDSLMRLLDEDSLVIVELDLSGCHFLNYLPDILSLCPRLSRLNITETPLAIALLESAIDPNAQTREKVQEIFGQLDNMGKIIRE